MIIMSGKSLESREKFRNFWERQRNWEEPLIDEVLTINRLPPSDAVGKQKKIF